MSFQQEPKDHSCFFFLRAKKVIHEMPPSHFMDLRLVRNNLDKEGLKFQLEEHAVARILEVEDYRVITSIVNFNISCTTT